MTNVTINLYRQIYDGSYNVNGNNVAVYYRIQNSEWTGAFELQYNFVVNPSVSASPPDTFQTRAAGLSYLETAAFNTILTSLNSNPYITGSTFIQGSVADVQKAVVDYVSTHAIAPVPGTHITDAPTNSPTDAATNAASDNPTNYNLLSGLLGIADGLNSANTKQNAMATIVNANATKQNTIATNVNTGFTKLNLVFDALEANSLLAA